MFKPLPPFLLYIQNYLKLPQTTSKLPQNFWNIFKLNSRSCLLEYVLKEAISPPGRLPFSFSYHAENFYCITLFPGSVSAVLQTRLFHQTRIEQHQFAAVFSAFLLNLFLRGPSIIVPSTRGQHRRANKLSRESDYVFWWERKMLFVCL